MSKTILLLDIKEDYSTRYLYRYPKKDVIKYISEKIGREVMGPDQRGKFVAMRLREKAKALVRYFNLLVILLEQEDEEDNG